MQIENTEIISTGRDNSIIVLLDLHVSHFIKDHVIIKICCYQKCEISYIGKKIVLLYRKNAMLTLKTFQS